MARARNIKPGFFLNEVLGVADPFLSLLFAGLWCLADKEGRLEDRPLRIKAEVFPYRENLDVNGYITELSRLGFIQRYEVAGKRYIQVVGFKEHQNPHHTEKPSIIPAISDGCDLTVTPPLNHGENPTDSLIPDSLIPDSDMGANPKQKRFMPPTPDEVGEYMLEIGYHGNPQQFCDYYSSKGWMIGKNKMKDWKAAVRTWRANGYDRGIQSGTGTAGTGAKAGGSPKIDTTVKPAGYFAGDFPDRSDEW